MDSSTIPMDPSIWPSLSYSKSQVLCYCFNSPRHVLILNPSYISEAAASLLDNRLSLYIVPPTQLVSLSSPVIGYSSSLAFRFIDVTVTRHFFMTGWIVALPRKASRCQRRSVACNTSYMGFKVSKFPFYLLI